MVKPWTCPKCGKVCKRYETICDDRDCMGEAGMLNWLITQHPVGASIIVVLGATLVMTLIATLIRVICGV